MQKVKKLPQRQCVGCRERKEKRELIRVVRSPEGGISLDFKGKKPGRGAYRPRVPEAGEKVPRAGAGAGDRHHAGALRRAGKGDGERWISF